MQFQDVNCITERSSRDHHARQLAAEQKRHSLSQLTPSDCNPQLQSLLFSLLPLEIQNQIFELTVSQHKDKTELYPENTYYYQLGYRYDKQIYTSLLQTCHHVYLETNTILMVSTTHSF